MDMSLEALWINRFRYLQQVLEDTFSYFKARMGYRNVTRRMKDLSASGLQAPWRESLGLPTEPFAAEVPVTSSKAVESMLDHLFEDEPKVAGIRSALSTRAAQVIRSANQSFKAAEKAAEKKTTSYVSKMLEAVRELDADVTTLAANTPAASAKKPVATNKVAPPVKASAASTSRINVQRPELPVEGKSKSLDYPDGYHDNMAHLLEQNQFLSHSIDRLASQYFSQEEEDASAN